MYNTRYRKTHIHQVLIFRRLRMMKNALKVMACVMILTILFGDTSRTYASFEQAITETEANTDNMLQLSIGTGEEQVGYLECQDGNRGPEDFAIYEK